MLNPTPTTLHEFLAKNDITFHETDKFSAILSQKALIFTEARVKIADILENQVSIRVATRSNTSLMKVITRATTRSPLEKENTILKKFENRGFLFNLSNISMGAKPY